MPLSKFVSVQELKGEINFSQVIVNYERASKDLLKEIQGSYKYRIEELSDGKLEETTGFEEQDIEYEQVREEFELLPMDYYENKKVEKVTVKSRQQVILYTPLGYRAHKPIYINAFRSYFFHF